MTPYTAMKARAADLIERKGAVVTVTYRAEAAYDTATGTAATSTTTETAYGVLLPYSTGLRNMPGSTIEAGHQQLMLAALDTDGDTLTKPRPNDRATIGGEVFDIVEVTAISPDNTGAIYYDCKVAA